jgi:hypothetical protein
VRDYITVREELGRGEWREDIGNSKHRHVLIVNQTNSISGFPVRVTLTPEDYSYYRWMSLS